ncbi:MAG: carboxymuconolactone decarboxylase family protein [Myxococcales bacterium]|nr:carboxymuconolactone decarboxylase family protein [Myxococcales bacterium]
MSRLEPIDTPPSLLGKFMSFAQRRMLGKAITPSKVVYNRLPRMWNLSWALVNLEMRGYTLDEELGLLVHVRASLLNGCGFCADIAKARAVQQKLGMEKFAALGDWESSPLFDARERAVLAYVDEMQRTRDVCDETFEGLRKNFNEREIVEVVVANAIANFYNMLNVPLRIEDDGLQAIAERRLQQ